MSYVTIITTASSTSAVRIIYSRIITSSLFLSIGGNDEIDIEGMKKDQRKPDLYCVNQTHLKMLEPAFSNPRTF